MKAKTCSAYSVCASIILLGSIYVGIAFAQEGLWGTVDEPDVPPPSVTTKGSRKGVPAAAVPQPIDINAPDVPPVAVTPQKTTCDLLTAQQILTPEIMNNPKFQYALRNNVEGMPVEYQALFANPDAINKVYMLYRTQYLKKYCS